MAKQNANPLDVLADACADRIVKDVESFPEATVPFGGVKLNREEQLLRYQQVRGDPEAWQQLISTEGLPAVLRYVKSMEGDHGNKIQTQAGQRGPAVGESSSSSE